MTDAGREGQRPIIPHLVGAYAPCRDGLVLNGEYSEEQLREGHDLRGLAARSGAGGIDVAGDEPWGRADGSFRGEYCAGSSFESG